MSNYGPEKGLEMVGLSDAEIKSFLEGAPLYHSVEFKKPQVNREDLRVAEVEAYCEVCEASRPFHDCLMPRSPSMTLRALGTGSSDLAFKCVSCRESVKFFSVFHAVAVGSITLTKFGEYPRKPLQRDIALQKFFSDDRDYYEKAVVCIANGYGIGAFAYMRRLIEANISRLLDMIQAEGKASGQSSDTEGAISELRQESPMSDKVKIANRALPAYLIPEGTNPLGRLYRILSEGVHSLSDEECLAKAVGIMECIKYLVAELNSRQDHRESFKRAIGAL